MKALSIQQPWAELILLGIKDIENRTWKTNVRGDILIHASKKFDMESFKGMQAEGYFRDKTKNDFQMGGIVGKTTIVDCVTDSDSEWFSGDYGFVLEKSERTAFIPYKGELGFFNVEDDTVDRIHRFCHDCNKDNSYLGEKDFYMIKDELWEKHGVGSQMLCMDCIEKRLGHPLTVADISLCKVTTIHNAYTRSLLENEGIYNGMCLLKKELAYNLRVKVLHTVDSDMNYNVGKIGRIHDRLIWFKNVCCVLNENWIVQVQY